MRNGNPKTYTKQTHILLQCYTCGCDKDKNTRLCTNNECRYSKKNRTTQKN